MRLPWKRRLETRQGDYTDAVIALLQTQATGTSTPTESATAALEACSGLVARAFSAAEVSGPSLMIEPLTPSFMSMIGRALIRRGDFVAYLDVTDGMLNAYPASDWDVWGTHIEQTYRVNLAGPNRTQTRNRVRSESVVHFKYMADPKRPWYGIGPIEAASIAGKLSAATAKALADESGGPRGGILPVPGGDKSNLKSTLKNLAGSVAIVEDAYNAFDTDRAAAGTANYNIRRMGANPPEALVNLNEQATKEVLMAVGISPALFDATAGSASREAYRQVLFGVVAPLGRVVEAELRAKIHPEITLTWDELRAADIASRAKAFQGMIAGGMELGKAAALSGLMMESD